MRELNPVGREGDSLLLVAADGEKFTLSVDDSLVKTIKNRRVPDTNSNDLSPREIQDAIRSGVSITKLAETSGSSLDMIERFAHPVLEELTHMVDLAKGVRVEQPADRFNHVSKRPFGEIIEERLAVAGALGVVWSAKRGDNAIWQVSVEFDKSGEHGTAIWSFDPRKYSLTPESTLAASLLNSGVKQEGILGPTNLPKASRSDSPEVATDVVTEDNLLAFRNRRNQTNPASALMEETLDESTPEEVISFASEVADEPKTADLVTEAEAASSPSPSEPEKPADPKKVRAPMPSWDQIVRGTQSDDGEAF